MLEKKTWCFDGFVNETKKEDLKDIVEREETAKFDQVSDTELSSTQAGATTPP